MISYKKQWKNIGFPKFSQLEGISLPFLLSNKWYKFKSCIEPEYFPMHGNGWESCVTNWEDQRAPRKK